MKRKATSKKLHGNSTAAKQLKSGLVRDITSAFNKRPNPAVVNDIPRPPLGPLDKK